MAAAILWRCRPSPHQPVSLAPDSNRRPPGMTRSEWRKVGLLTLRGYIIFAIIVMAIKLVQVTTAH
jgi:hypothetical protein